MAIFRSGSFPSYRSKISDCKIGNVRKFVTIRVANGKAMNGEKKKHFALLYIKRKSYCIESILKSMRSLERGELMMISLQSKHISFSIKQRGGGRANMKL